jgi:hypothetical protein
MEIVVTLTLPNNFTTTQDSSKRRDIVANWNGGSNDELYPPSADETTSSWDSTTSDEDDDDDEDHSQSSNSEDSGPLCSEEDCPATKALLTACVMSKSKLAAVCLSSQKCLLEVGSEKVSHHSWRSSRREWRTSGTSNATSDDGC